MAAAVCFGRRCVADVPVAVWWCQRGTTGFEAKPKTSQDKQTSYFREVMRREGVSRSSSTKSTLRWEA